MKLFLTFFFLAIICSLAMRKVSQRSMTLLMFLISAGVVFGYFFLNQI